MTVKEYLEKNKGFKEIYILYFDKKMDLQCNCYKKSNYITNEFSCKEVLEDNVNNEERWVELWV